MADLTTTFAGVTSPNPFWLASAPPTNTGDQIKRAFDYGWGGAVWKTLGDPIVDTSSRFGALEVGGQHMVGFNNIELITDRPLELNLREMREVKKKYPKQVIVASLMVEKKEDWRDIIAAVIDNGADAIELNFGCPHGMCERGMGSAVGAEPEVLKIVAGWAVEYSTVPVLVKLTPEHRRHPRGGRARGRGGRARALAHQHDQEPDRRRSRPHGAVSRRRQALDQRRLLRPRGEADRAAHGRGARPRSAHQGADLGHRRHRDVA
jgi:dihydropyrimidine dehydrogenase (NAD+) subunit PreA